jgi:gliding motility-associated-like protein
LATSTYTVIGTDIHGCTDTAQAQVVVRTDCLNPLIIVPTAFTPNGDGINDLFRIERAENYTLISMQVFNRWGGVVFETSDAHSGWDGRYGNNPQPIGSYVYLLYGADHWGRPMRHQGNVTLLR